MLEKETVVPDRKQSETQTERKTPVETESTETNTYSPEKKKKFVWRKREKRYFNNFLYISLIIIVY